MIRTKIIATMGPAVATPETLLTIFNEGVDICRLNFSHGDLATHSATLKLIRETAQKFMHPIAVLGDLCGPKIRLGKVADEQGTGGMIVNVGDEIIVHRETLMGENKQVSTTLATFCDDVQVGHRILVEDGLLRFIVTETTHETVKMLCKVGGILKSAKGINLPDSVVNVPSLTDRDWECVDWAVANDLDFLALSFVRKSDDIKLLRGHLQYKKASNVGLIAKIEKPEALNDLDNIIDAADGLMVARGDLGVEMDVARVPLIQKDIIRRCTLAGKPVIVATQMLQSMVEVATPTRAEVSDVANAILDGTDAVMLSAETSVGKFPTVAVHTMEHVAQVTEEYLDSIVSVDMNPPRLSNSDTPAAALARGAWRVARDMKIKLVVIWSQTGSTARVFSKHRFNCAMVALSSDPRVLRRMAIHYGVNPLQAERPGSMAELVQMIDKLVIERRYAVNNDRILIVAGWSPSMPDTMNGMILHTVGQKWLALSPTGARPSQAEVK